MKIFWVRAHNQEPFSSILSESPAAAEALYPLMTCRAPPAPEEGLWLSVTNYTFFRQISSLSNMPKLPCLIATNNVNLFVCCLCVDKGELVESHFSLPVHVTPFYLVLGIQHWDLHMLDRFYTPESHPIDLPNSYQLKKMKLMQY